MMEGCGRGLLLAGLILLLPAIVSCHSAQRREVSSHLGMTPHVEINRTHDWQLASRSRVYIAYPEAKVPGQSDLPRTRSDLHRLIGTEAAPRFQAVVSGTSGLSFEQVFAAAKDAGCDVVFRTMITAARFGEKNQASIDLFNGIQDNTSRPDYQELKFTVQVYEAHSSRLLDTAAISAKRPWPASERAQNTLGPAAVNALINSFAR